MTAIRRNGVSGRNLDRFTEAAIKKQERRSRVRREIKKRILTPEAAFAQFPFWRKNKASAARGLETVRNTAVKSTRETLIIIKRKRFEILAFLFHA
ncbi:hypothetical protein CDAR_78321 [Caerostris darwini]|uniref:Uncharacterized protein n=1 Tax=Caerostris darwini TaxID=1538125 RepID=A0AAV4SE77_9ARAC|nr:hypothetical protein CDAR_78321 [Caerostris darwini]